jgi:hypothetical protein
MLVLPVVVQPGLSQMRNEWTWEPCSNWSESGKDENALGKYAVQDEHSMQVR